MSDPLIVIGLTGYARSGKDSVAAFLAAHAQFQTMALADAIRDSVDSLDGRTWAYRKERGSAHMSERKALQLLGTECRERLGCEFLWCELAAAKMLYASQHHPVPRSRFVIPDLRYAHEDVYFEDTVRELGGHYENWRITRPSLVKIAESDHSSEQHIEDIAYSRMIQNTGSLNLLAQRTLEALSFCLKEAKKAVSTQGTCSERPVLRVIS